MTRSALALLMCLSLSGCLSVQYDNAARLMAREDWLQARDAAPEWCRAALKTINALEYELERQ